MHVRLMSAVTLRDVDAAAGVAAPCAVLLHQLEHVDPDPHPCHDLNLDYSACSAELPATQQVYVRLNKVELQCSA